MTYDPTVVFCLECGEPIRDPEKNGWEESTNFAKRRSQGGQNQARLKRPTGRWMCSDCMEKLCLGIDVNQLGLALP